MLIPSGCPDIPQTEMSVSEKGFHVIKHLIWNSKIANIHSTHLPLFTQYRDMLAHCSNEGLEFSDDHDHPTIYNITLVNMILFIYLLKVEI